MIDWGDVSWDVRPTKTKSKTIDEKAVEERAIKRRLSNDELHTKVARRLDELCVRPRKGEQWRIITEKAFNAYAFICSLLAEGEIDELWIAIYRINEPTVDSLIDLISQGKIRRAHFIISNFFNQTKRPEKWALKLARFCDENKGKTSFAYLHNHAKIVCAHKGGDFYVFEGSGNMSDNARIEQYTYENSRQMYDFHTSWMTDLIAKENDKKRDTWD